MTADPVHFVLAAFRGHGRSRSRLYWWMAEHHAELAAAKQAGRRVDWISVTAEMTRLGFKAAGKQALKPETVRRTWHRVDADVKAGVIVPGISNPAPKPAAITPPIRPPTPPPPPQAGNPPELGWPEQDEEGPIVEPRSRFKLQRPVDINPFKKES
jgi:hypothetical protein